MGAEEKKLKDTIRNYKKDILQVKGSIKDSFKTSLGNFNSFANNAKNVAGDMKHANGDPKGLVCDISSNISTVANDVVTRFNDIAQRLSDQKAQSAQLASESLNEAKKHLGDVSEKIVKNFDQTKTYVDEAKTALSERANELKDTLSTQMYENKKAVDSQIKNVDINNVAQNIVNKSKETISVAKNSFVDGLSILSTNVQNVAEKAKSYANDISNQATSVVKKSNKNLSQNVDNAKNLLVEHVGNANNVSETIVEKVTSKSETKLAKKVGEKVAKRIDLKHGLNTSEMLKTTEDKANKLKDKIEMMIYPAVAIENKKAVEKAKGKLKGKLKANAISKQTQKAKVNLSNKKAENSVEKHKKQSGFFNNLLFVSLVNPLIYKALEQIIIPKTQGKKFIRTNYAGRQVNLYGGIVSSSALALSNLGLFALNEKKTANASLVATTSSAIIGYVDDLDNGKSEGEISIKGFKGHLRALSQGKITTGVIKIIGIGSASILSSILLTPKNKCKGIYLYDLILNATTISAMANLHNLLDLRPGRCLKFSGALNALMLFANKKSQNIALNNLSIIACALPSDVCEKTMLGDTGANALGSASGVGIAKLENRFIKSAILASTLGLTVLSEKFSFSKIIDSNLYLKKIDDFGRLLKADSFDEKL